MSSEDNNTPSPFPEFTHQDLAGMERQILADSAAWERRVPKPDAFNARLRRRLTEEHMREQEPSPPASWLAETTSEQESVSLPSPRLRPPSQTRTLLAVAAAVVIVGLLAAVFASLTHGRTQQSPAASATATATAAASTTPAPVHSLAARPPILKQPGTPVVAPSDPNVIYEYADNGPNIVLRRSDDGGASWHDLSYPSAGAFVAAIEVAVNPTNAQNVFLRLDLGYQPGGLYPCRQTAMIEHGGILASGGVNCRAEFYSRDGGQHWNHIHLPVAGTLFQSGVTFAYDATTVQAGGGTLYGRVWQLDATGAQIGDIRIVSTQNEGQSWQAVDEVLLRYAPHICAFTAAPEGNTIFATTSTRCWSSVGGQAGPRTLWHSSDGGAHWTAVSGFPQVMTRFDTTFVAANLNGDPAQPLLYTIGPSGSDGEQVYATNDLGTSWHVAPLTGLPNGAQLDLAATQPLSDGSLVVAFTEKANVPLSATPTAPAAGSATATIAPTATPTPFGGGGSTVAVYLWRGDMSSWRQLTPPTAFSGPNVSNVFVSEGSARAVTLSVADDLSSNPTYTVQRFQ